MPDSFQEVLTTSGASDADDDWPHTRLGDELECQEGATLALCHKQFRYKPDPLAITRKPKSVTFLKFFSFNDSRPESGKESRLALA
jgi:hypothetical protein